MERSPCIQTACSHRLAVLVLNNYVVSTRDRIAEGLGRKQPEFVRKRSIEDFYNLHTRIFSNIRHM